MHDRIRQCVAKRGKIGRGRMGHGLNEGERTVFEEERGNFYKTGLERKAEDILIDLKVEFIPQYPTRTGYLLDFAVFLNEKRIDLEIDGHRWHTDKKARKRDNFRNYLLKRDGWETFRVREKFFNEDFDRFKMGLLG